MKFIGLNGQVSIEFMIIFAAFLSILFVFVSASMDFFEAGSFFLELRKAESFSEQLNSVLSEVYSFSSGSNQLINSSISFPWIISCNEKKCLIEVLNKVDSKKIDFNLFVPVENFSFEFEKEINLSILKKNNFVEVQKN